MTKKTATEKQVLEWIYECLDKMRGNIGCFPEEFLAEYFEDETGMRLPKRFRGCLDD